MHSQAISSCPSMHLTPYQLLLLPYGRSIPAYNFKVSALNKVITFTVPGFVFIILSALGILTVLSSPVDLQIIYLLLPRKHFRSTLSTSSSNSRPTQTPSFKRNCFSLSFVCVHVHVHALFLILVALKGEKDWEMGSIGTEVWGG